MTSNSTPNPVLIIDFGAQYAQLITRRVREAGIYAELVPHTVTADELKAKQPSALILSGGPSSVYEPDTPQADSAWFELGLPIFGICYGFQAMTKVLGGEVRKTGLSEFGRTKLAIENTGTLLADVPNSCNVWMSHGDEVASAPADFNVLATTEGATVAAFENLAEKMAGVQFHPEVKHTENGQTILEHFLFNVADLEKNWSTENIVETQVAAIKTRIGNDHAICGLSGGVDSAVAAALVQRAIGDQLTCVFVDHGLLRQGEAEQVEKDFVASTGANLHIVDASKQFLDALKDVKDPEEKRKIIGREFIRTFEKAEAEVIEKAGGKVKFLVQGTLYPDIVESGGGSGTHTIKSHHNVGGLPDDLEFEIVEPLRDLFKDEVRAVGRELGLPEEIVNRQPFPGPGLGIRIVGEVTAERLEVLRKADAIAREELTAAGLDDTIWQCPVVLLGDVRSVGVQGDGRTYGHPIVLRPVTSEDAMTADWTRVPYETLEKISSRITNEVRAVNRVTLDITSKPPGTIEWE
ncbi:MAG TPA: glutamine-hydrolyzing GMP synthase [Candidatus Saccharimonadales bacterium]